MGASSRLRTLQYLPYLEAAGWQVDVLPLFNDSYLQGLYDGRKPGLEALRSYGGRLRQLRWARHADLIWLEKEALPWVPWLAENALLPRSATLVVDYDDAVFHRYDLHRNPVVRRILGRKLDHLMARANCVTAGNPYLAERALRAGTAKVEVVPTVVDVSAYHPAKMHGAGQQARPVVGWIGSPSTWREYMIPMMPILESAMGAAGASMLVVGASLHPSRSRQVEFRPWSEETEVADIREMAIGLMPLRDDPWARGKCGYKLIQYMACGVPVIASPVGVNRDIVEHGVNGFLASTEEEWRDALAALMADPDLRLRMGRAGRAKIETSYSLQALAPRLLRIFENLTDLPPGPVGMT